MGDRIRAALKHSSAEYCEIRVEETLETSISFRGRNIDRVSQSVVLGGNVRALKNGGWGFVSFNSLQGLEKKVEEASAQAHMLGVRLKKEIKLYPVSPVEDCVESDFKNPAFRVPLARKVGILEAYNELVLESPEITSSFVRYFDRQTRAYFANSEGTYITQEKMDLGGGITAMAAKNGLTTQDSVFFGSNNDFDVALNKEDKVRQAAARARELLYAPVIRAGEYTVILDPDMAGLFAHEAFGHLSESDDLDEDERMRDLMKIGTRYGSQELNIFDSGIEGGNRGEAKYDDEGVPMGKTYLIKDGVIAGHLHSRESAWKMQEKPTGNARALNYAFPPIVRMRTTCIGPGKHSLDQMMKDISLGVYVKGGYGGQTNGEMFTFAASCGYMIRQGAISEPVRDVNLTGNVFTTLRNIDMIGNDFSYQNSPGGCGKGGQSPLPTAGGSPHIRVQKVIIGGDK